VVSSCYYEMCKINCLLLLTTIKSMLLFIQVKPDSEAERLGLREGDQVSTVLLLTFYSCLLYNSLCCSLFALCLCTAVITVSVTSRSQLCQVCTFCKY